MSSMSGKKETKEIQADVNFIEGVAPTVVSSTTANHFYKSSGKEFSCVEYFKSAEQCEAKGEKNFAAQRFQRACELVNGLELSELDMFSTRAIKLSQEGRYLEAIQCLEAWMRRYDKAIHNGIEFIYIAEDRHRLRSSLWVLQKIAENYFLLADYDKVAKFTNQIFVAIAKRERTDIDFDYYKFLSFQFLAMKDLVLRGYTEALKSLERHTSTSNLGRYALFLSTLKNYLRVKAGRGDEALAEVETIITTKKQDKKIGSHLPYMVQKISILLEMGKYEEASLAVQTGVKEVQDGLKGLARAIAFVSAAANENMQYGEFFAQCENCCNSKNWSKLRKYLERAIGQNLPNYVRGFELSEAKIPTAQFASGDVPVAAVTALGPLTSPVVDEAKLAVLDVPPSRVASEQRALAETKINELQALIEKEEKDGQRAELYIKKGKILAEPLQQYTEALANFNHAINCLSRQGQFKEEREAYIYLLCGLTCSKAGEAKKGERYFQLALKASPAAVTVATKEEQNVGLSDIQRKCVNLWKAAIDQGYVPATFVTQSNVAQRQGQNAAAPLPLPPSVATNRHTFAAGISNTAAAETGSNPISAKKA